mmetsp:Transcript_84311/g.217118  ORF Transcript_84311/g.217118 Transcript_84311/m.217118 type:complete len:200 (+) Transcript_84311:672-1271(+)
MLKGRPVGCSFLMERGIFSEPMPTAGSASDISAWKELSITDGPIRKPFCVPSRSISSRAMPSVSFFCTCRTQRNRRCNGKPHLMPKEYMRSMSTFSGCCLRISSKSCTSSGGKLSAHTPVCLTNVASTCVVRRFSSGSSPTSLSTSSRPSVQMQRRSSTGSSMTPSKRRSTNGFAKPRLSMHHGAWPMYSPQPARIISR